MKLLIVDDHPLLREGVASVLRQFADGVQVLQASDGQAALALAAQHLDLSAVLLDLHMDGMAGIATLTQLRQHHPGLPVLVLSSSEDPGDVRRVLAAGGRGYCPKSASHTTLLAALRLVLGGEVYVPPLMAQALAAPRNAADASAITERQNQVLQLLGKGMSNKDIARALGMQEKTVKGHVSAIFRALHVVHRMQAVQAARASGLIS